MKNKLEFFHSMMRLAIKKGNLVEISGNCFSVMVRVKEEEASYYNCEGINMIFKPKEFEIEKVERYECAGYYKRMVRLTDGTTFKVSE